MRGSLKVLKEKFDDFPLIGVEVGVESGNNASQILEILNMKELHLIDIWDAYEQDGWAWNFSPLYEQVVERFKDHSNVSITKVDSVVASLTFIDNSLDFVYIDANHQLEYVKEDIAVWYPKVKPGGYLCGHDYIPMFTGVINAVQDFVTQSGLVLHTKQENERSVDWWVEKA